MSDEEMLKNYVEDKIFTYVFKAKNFSKEDMDFVNSYCKDRYDNNRKLMILDLIKFKEDNILFDLLDQKINFIYNELLSKIQDTPEEETKKKVAWQGFNKDWKRVK